jgi:histidinol-phosphate aminotransferase
MPRAFDRLTAMGLEPRPSVANFMIVRVPERTGKTADAAVAHLASRGIFVRESASYGLPDHFRFSIGTDDDMALFLCETAAFMGHGHV